MTARTGAVLFGITYGLVSVCAVSVSCPPANAQTPPANVNDCTLIQNPVELRNCILRFEGQSNIQPLPQTRQDSSEDVAPVTRPDTKTEGPPRTGVRSSGSSRDGLPQPRPARDTPTSIEQIEVPRPSRRP